MNGKSKIPKSVKLKTYLVTVLLISVIFAGALNYVLSNGYVGEELEPWLTLPLQEASYIIGQYNSTHYYARNSTGYGTSANKGYEMLSMNGTAILQNCYGNLADGGVIYLKTMVTCDSTVKATNSTTLQGAGWHTGLQLASGSTCNLIENIDKVTNGNDDIIIKDLALIGQYSEYGAGNTIDFENPDGWDGYMFLTLDNVLIENSNQIAVNINYGRFDFQRVFILRCGTKGMYMEDVYDSHMSHIYISTNNEETLHIYKGGENSFESWYLGGTAGDNNEPQLLLDTTVKNKFSDFQIDNTHCTAINLTNSHRQFFENFLITRCSQQTDNTWDAVTVTDSTYNSFSNIYIGKKYAADTKYARCGVNETGASDYNQYVNINAEHVHSYTLNLVGIHDKCSNIIGTQNVYFENGGTQTCADNENIAHGLAGTPTMVQVTSMNDTYDGVAVIATVDWSNVDSTNIQVGLYWVNGTAITDDVILVSWSVEYKP